MTSTFAPSPVADAAADVPRRRLRTGGHLRISSDPKDKREGVGRQQEDVTVLSEAYGLEIVEWFIDNDTSASKGLQRKRWNELLAKIESGELDAIAAWDQDRNWRMMSELEDLRKFFKKLRRKIPLFTTGQGEIDLDTPTGILQVQIKTAVSEHEIAMMKVRQRRAAKGRAQTGKPKWRKAFGYLPYTGPKEDDNGNRYPDPVTAPLVAQAYKVLIAGTSISDIARTFNEAGAYGLNGRPWTATTVSLFLRSPRNAGLRAHTHADENDDEKMVTEIVCTGTWEPLVKESTWRAAQDKLNAPGRAPGRKTVRRHLLTGVLRCGKCGRPLNGMQTMTKTISYRCRSSVAMTDKGCGGVGVAAHHIEKLLYDTVGGRLAMPDAVDLLKAEIHNEAEAEEIRTELATLYHDRDHKHPRDCAKHLITSVQLQNMTAIINEDIAKLQRRQLDQERLRVFDGIPLGTPEAVAAVNDLTPDRFRAVVAVLMAPVIEPVGKGGHVFDPERLKPNWR